MWNLPSYIFTTVAEPVPGAGEEDGWGEGKVHAQVTAALSDGGGVGSVAQGGTKL